MTAILKSKVATGDILKEMLSYLLFESAHLNLQCMPLKNN